MILLLVVLLVVELCYFRLADRFKIVDKPNQRSSHSVVTRRGGGIIFPVAWILFSISQNLYLPWFTLGLVLIAAVSFWDDVKEVGVKTRLTLHTIALTLAFYDLGIVNMLPWWAVGICIIISIAALNAINFMDGINGITGMHSLVFWITIALFAGVFSYTDVLSLSSPVPYLVSALLIFGFFNFRKKAICFAGDSGSVSMAYLMIGMIVFLIFKPVDTMFSEVGALKSGELLPGFELKYLLLLTVYGIDSFLTIIHRLILGENILRGHRKHLYQYLVNEFKLPHLVVASVYATLQLAISLWVLNTEISMAHAITLLVILTGFYLLMKAHIIQYAAVPPSSVPEKIILKPSISKAIPEPVNIEEVPEVMMPPYISEARKATFKQNTQRETSTTLSR